jgi:hypothetical protein
MLLEEGGEEEAARWRALLDARKALDEERREEGECSRVMWNDELRVTWCGIQGSDGRHADSEIRGGPGVACIIRQPLLRKSCIIPISSSPHPLIPPFLATALEEVRGEMRVELVATAKAMAEAKRRALECAVCLMELEGGGEGLMAEAPLACGHGFLVLCVETWVAKCRFKGLEPTTCPTCRGGIGDAGV